MLMNLAETQITIRRWFLIIVLMTFTYYTGKFLFFAGLGVYNQMFPKEIPPPPAAFGMLPMLEMPSHEILGSPSYILETDSGTLPNFSDRINVYKVIKPTPNLLAESQMKSLAATLNFSTGFTKKNVSEFQWIDGNAEKTMWANVITKEFIVKTKLDKLGSVLSSVNTITEDDGINMVSGFIKSKGLLPKAEEDTMRFETVPTIVNLAKYQDMKRFPKQSKVIKVNVYREINQLIPFKQESASYNILGPNPKNSLMSFYVTNEADKYKFPDIDFTHWEVDMESKSMYPISNIVSVWDVIKAGKGVIAYVKLDEKGYYSTYKPINIAEIQIRKIELAYFEPKEYAEYLQPIYVFSGTFKTNAEAGTLAKKGEIVIYYPAVTGEYVQQPAPVVEKVPNTQPQIENITPKTTNNKPEEISTGIQ